MIWLEITPNGRGCSFVVRFCFRRGSVPARRHPFVLLVCGLTTFCVWSDAAGESAGTAETVPSSFAGSVGVGAFVFFRRVLPVRKGILLPS